MRDKTYSLCRAATRKSFQYLDLAKKLYKIEIDDPIIIFSLKGQYAGKAYYIGAWMINYNFDLLKAYKKEFLKVTVPHEVAHLVEFKRFGSTGHKQNWKQIMKDFGISNPQRCHNYIPIK
jgi:SprT protein